ncbi:hypothetical protein ABMA27_016757 [Loxostege sticticalis]|uniref:Regulatory protein zeste n=1 Tax=Loxostege sticticalis TaxID=481309 RepID=A0ABR3I3H0_LOXSC
MEITMNRLLQKSVPLTKEEVMQLVDLVEAHPVLFSKATNASNNQLKEATWLIITNTFNSMVASNPRKPEQHRLKWENLKKREFGSDLEHSWGIYKNNYGDTIKKNP